MLALILCLHHAVKKKYDNDNAVFVQLKRWGEGEEEIYVGAWNISGIVTRDGHKPQKF